MVDPKRTALDHIYGLYEDITKSLNVACARGCCACCTQHVTMTTLEGCRIIGYVREKMPQVDLEIFTRRADACRFRPNMTTNALADHCLQGKEAPDEESGSTTAAACLFLVNHECMIYDARPFGCRCFFSTVRCSEQAFASVEPFLLTVNTIFLQSIEHVDVGGFFGNMYEVLYSFVANQHNAALADIRTVVGQKALAAGDDWPRIAKNHPIPAFMIPPEHRDQARPIVDALKRILGRTKWAVP